jgi:hypothetical protein
MMMKVRVWITLAVALVVGSAAMAQRGLPPNPFLVRPVNSLEQLIEQVKKEPVVMSRYCRHFQLTPEALLEMLSSLKAGRLTSDGEYEVFNVPAKTGVIRSRILKLRKGERVFVDRSGTPVILMVCGNPMARLDSTDVGSIALDITGASSLKAISLDTPADAVVDQVTVIEPVLPIAPDVAFAAPPAPGEGVTVTETSEAPFLAPIAFLPTALLAFGGTGGGNPIPEPATMITLGAGVALLAARAKRRRR